MKKDKAEAPVRINSMQLKHEPATLRDIAVKLNISVSTASRALSDHPRIAFQTKMRVRELAAKLNYEPNAKAIFFKQKKSYTIGVIIPYIREDFFSHAICGIERVAIENNYTILFGQSYDDIEKEKSVVSAMRKYRVDGLIISLSKQTGGCGHLDMLAQYDIPVVYFDRVPRREDVHKVHCRLSDKTTELTKWLIGKGFKRVGFINGPDKLSASRERLKGYIEGVAQRKLKVDMQLVETTDLSKESTVRAMENLINQHHPPGAIISFNDYVHMDAVQYAERRGIRVNEDIVFASFANLPITSYTAHPPLASIEQYPFRQGEKAMELMMTILNRPERNFDSPFVCEEIEAALIINRTDTGVKIRSLNKSRR